MHFKVRFQTDYPEKIEERGMKCSNSRYKNVIVEKNIIVEVNFINKLSIFFPISGL